LQQPILKGTRDGCWAKNYTLEEEEEEEEEAVVHKAQGEREN